MSKYEDLKYVLSGATDWGYEYAKKEDVEAAFAKLEERHAMELDQWVLELGKMKAENERLKKDIDTLKTAWEQSQSALSTIAALKLAAEEKHRATRRALYKACANWAYATENLAANFLDVYEAKKWAAVYAKCAKKAEEYKEVN